MAHPPILIGGASRPYPGETANGDAWQVDWQQDGACRIAVIDALGHGPQAAAEAARALEALTANPEFAPEGALKACHRALAGGRGAAMSVAQIDPVAGRLVFVGIGNVEAVLWTPHREQRLSADRGIVGSVSRTLHPVSISLGSDWLLLVYTDGVSARFHIEDLLRSSAFEPQSLATMVLDQWGRSHDDATVVIACGGERSAPVLLK